jgi:triosephosphate isomerase (TIM)
MSNPSVLSPGASVRLLADTSPRLVIGSHKVFLDLPGAVKVSRGLAERLRERPVPFDVVICPSLINLAHVAESVRDSPVHVAAQTVHQERSGAFTGQVSLEELEALHVRHVVIGHCELVTHQRERTSDMAVKIGWCLRHGITPIVCIGDTPPDGSAAARVASARRRIHALFDAAAGAAGVGGLAPSATPVIVYEPAGGCGTSDASTRTGIRAVVETIRAELRTVLGTRGDDRPCIVIGGGVTEANVATVIRDFDVDGVIAGRACVDLDAFLRLLDAAQRCTVDA